MRTEIQVRFDRQERDIVKDAQASIRLVLAPEDPEARALSTITSGANVSHATLERARRGLSLLVQACAQQVAGDWWYENAVVEPGDTPGGIGLIADVDQFVATMVTARTQQLREARAALTLVREALALAVPAAEESC